MLKSALILGFIECMEIAFKKKRNSPLEAKITIPLTREVKQKLDTLKHNYRIDMNEMIRIYLDGIIKQVESGEINLS